MLINMLDCNYIVVFELLGTNYVESCFIFAPVVRPSSSKEVSSSYLMLTFIRQFEIAN